MDWNRGVRPNQPAGASFSHPANTTEQSAHAAVKKKSKASKLTDNRLGSFIAIALLLTGVVGSFLLFNNRGAEGVLGTSDSASSDKMQAVFLNGGQVYFGKITDIRPGSLRLEDIYYLRVNQQVQPNQQSNQQSNDISLVKLGCELHGPEDAMVINQDQVIFWENLKTDGQVAKAVEEYKKQNPDGQKCEQPAQQSSGGAQQQQTPASTGTGTQQNTNTGTQSQPNNTQRR